MRFFITVALALMPIAVVQFFPSISQAFVITSPAKQNSQARLIDEHQLKKSGFVEDRTIEAKEKIVKKKHKRVELVKGKKNTDGMKLLSMLLMLKEKK
jgi:hypothetical protein